MCIRDRLDASLPPEELASVKSILESYQSEGIKYHALRSSCLLYTSDAADERSSVDLGGRRIIKKKKKQKQVERKSF